MLSAAYQQSSQPRADGDKVDHAEYPAVAHESAASGHRILSRYAAARGGASGHQMYGPSEDVDFATNVRRTVMDA